MFNFSLTDTYYNWVSCVHILFDNCKLNNKVNTFNLTGQEPKKKQITSQYSER